MNWGEVSIQEMICCLCSGAFRMTCERRNKLTLRKRRAISIGELCTDLPEELADYMNYWRDVSPDESPDYAFLQTLLRDLYDESRLRLRQRV